MLAVLFRPQCANMSPDKLSAILKTGLSHEYSWTKMSECRFKFRESPVDKNQYSIDSGNGIYAVQVNHDIWSSIIPWNYNLLRKEIKNDIWYSDINNSIYHVIITMDNLEEDWLILKLRLQLKSSKLKFQLKSSELEFDL